MIKYIEKGQGLHEAIAEAGHSLYELDGMWVASDEAAVQAIINGYEKPTETEAEIKARKLRASLSKTTLTSEEIDKIVAIAGALE